MDIPAEKESLTPLEEFVTGANAYLRRCSDLAESPGAGRNGSRNRRAVVGDQYGWAKSNSRLSSELGHNGTGQTEGGWEDTELRTSASLIHGQLAGPRGHADQMSP